MKVKERKSGKMDSRSLTFFLVLNFISLKKRLDRFQRLFDMCQD